MTEMENPQKLLVGLVLGICKYQDFCFSGNSLTFFSKYSRIFSQLMVSSSNG